MNPFQKPLIINTRSKMFAFIAIRLLLTGTAVVGFYFSRGILDAAVAYVSRFIVGRVIYRHCFDAAVARESQLLVQWTKEEAEKGNELFEDGNMVSICHESAIEQVKANIKGDS